MGFSNDQMIQAIEKGGIVGESVETIKKTCQTLKENTNCPDEDIDSLLNFLIGRWN